jgi:protein arginine kinase
MEQDRLARKYLTKNPIELEDKIYRDYGILSNAMKLEENETLELLSFIKLGVDLGIIKEISDSKVSKLYLYTKPANLQIRIGKELKLNEQEIERANVVKEIIKSDE